MVRSALALRDHVVNREVPKREDHGAPGAPPLLLPEELMLVRPVVRDRSEVRPARDVGSMVDVIEELERLLEPRFNQRSG